MKVIIIADVDPDKLFGTACGGSVPPELNPHTVGELVEQELDWVAESGIRTLRIIEPDEIHSNDQILGS